MRRLYLIGDGAWAGAEPEEADEEGRWEGRERTTTKAHCMVRGDDDYNEYAPPHPESEASAVWYNSGTEIPFAFGPRYAGSPPILKG